MARAASVFGLIAILLIGACRFFLPERFAVNAPLLPLLGLGAGETPSPDTIERLLQVPEGFSIALFAEGLRGARFLRFTPAGDLLVSQPREGQIALVLADRNGDGSSDGIRPLLTDLRSPHGIDLHQGWLYIAGGGTVQRVRFDDVTATTRGPLEILVDDLPTGGNHWTRSVRVGPDRRLYVSVGSSCNVCEEEDPRRAAILRFALDGSEAEIFATGLRNSVGFDWKPGTNELYATDNGRDLLGDNLPPCELNKIEAGGFYGWPYANGNRQPDPDFGAEHPGRVAESLPPAHAFRAHNAPLGMTFVRGTGSAELLRGAALVALHGSWNRRRKDGYRVVSLHWGPDGQISERDFATGFEVDGDVIGRPVDVAEGPDGAFYISDDYAGVIYRVAMGSRQAPALPSATARTEQHGDPLASLGAIERAERGARGAVLYESKGCPGCHESARANPGVVAKPLMALGQRYGLASLAAFFAAPTPPMPVVDLDASGRRDLAVHLLQANSNAAASNDPGSH